MLLLFFSIAFTLSRCISHSVSCFLSLLRSLFIAASLIPPFSHSPSVTSPSSSVIRECLPIASAFFFLDAIRFVVHCEFERRGHAYIACDIGARDI